MFGQGKELIICHAAVAKILSYQVMVGNQFIHTPQQQAAEMAGVDVSMDISDLDILNFPVDYIAQSLFVSNH